MSHIDDVINPGFNWAFQIYKKWESLKWMDISIFWTFDPSFWSEWSDAYLLHFSKTL